MGNDNVVGPGPPSTPHANLMRQLLDRGMDLGVLDSGNTRRSVRDMLSGPQIDLDDPTAVQAHVGPVRELVAELKTHLYHIHTVAGEARREAGR